MMLAWLSVDGMRAVSGSLLGCGVVGLVLAAIRLERRDRKERAREADRRYTYVPPNRRPNE